MKMLCFILTFMPKRSLKYNFHRTQLHDKIIVCKIICTSQHTNICWIFNMTELFLELCENSRELPFLRIFKTSFLFFVFWVFIIFNTELNWVNISLHFSQKEMKWEIILSSSQWQILTLCFLLCAFSSCWLLKRFHRKIIFIYEKV